MVSGILALPIFLGFWAAALIEWGDFPSIRTYVHTYVPPLASPKPSQSSLRPSQPGLRPTGPASQASGPVSQPSGPASQASGPTRKVYQGTDGQIDRLMGRQKFFPFYRTLTPDKAPALLLSKKQNKERANCKHKLSGVWEPLPLGDWLITVSRARLGHPG